MDVSRPRDTCKRGLKRYSRPNVSWTLVTVALSLLVAGCSHADTAASANGSSRTVGLTEAGRTLRNFEGLLRQLVKRPVPGEWPCTENTGRFVEINFSKCGDLAQFSPYFFNFPPTSRPSPFHVTRVRYVGGGIAGNYPIPVLYRGYLIACDSSDHLVLGEYSDSANWSLHCFTSPYVRMHRR